MPGNPSAREFDVSREDEDDYDGSVESVDVDVLPREEFLDKFGAEYNRGQHVSFFGPTQRGKTKLCHMMLKRVISPQHPCVILAGKPPGRDSTMEDAAKYLNLRIVEEWPPFRTWKDRQRNGYILRPRHTMKNLDKDDRNMQEHFRAAILGNYASRGKPVITVLDESYHVQLDLRLKKEAEAPLMRGAPDNAEWNLAQRGKMISYLCYDAPEWIIIFQEPTELERRRYAEIGGIDYRVVTELVKNLKTYTVKTKTGQGTISECLVFRRSGSEMFIVDVK